LEGLSASMSKSVSCSTHGHTLGGGSCCPHLIMAFNIPVLSNAHLARCSMPFSNRQTGCAPVAQRKVALVNKSVNLSSPYGRRNIIFAKLLLPRFCSRPSGPSEAAAKTSSSLVQSFCLRANNPKCYIDITLALLTVRFRLFA
jgi:hypothetical protein